jgi:transcriptional regulator with XRE-family HTH domain
MAMTTESDQKPNLNEFISHRIKQLRQQQHISQDVLSERATLDIKHINKIENGKINATVQTVDRIIHALGVTYAEFFDFTQDFDKQATIHKRISSLNNKELQAIVENLYMSNLQFDEAYGELKSQLNRPNEPTNDKK